MSEQNLKLCLAQLNLMVGDIVSNMDNQSPQGEVDGRDSPYLIIRYLIIGVLIYLVLSGKIDIDQANDAKDLLN